MKAIVLGLLNLLVLWFTRRLNAQPLPKPEGDPSHEENVRAMDKALADGDASAVTLLFEQLPGPPPTGSAGVPAGSGGQSDSR